MRPPNRWSERAAQAAMPLRRLLAEEAGSAALEFITVGMLLLVPLVYLVISLGSIQSQALGAEAGARHIARAVATAPDARSARSRADAILHSIEREYGLDSEAVRVELGCRPASARCPSAGVTMIVTVTTRVALPLAPAALGIDRIASIPVQATAAQRVSRFWGDG